MFQNWRDIEGSYILEVPPHVPATAVEPTTPIAEGANEGVERRKSIARKLP
jgi:hypothetical protein